VCDTVDRRRCDAESSYFNGLTIVFEYKEHNPPHFHVYKGKVRVGRVLIREIAVESDLISKEEHLLEGWTALYQDELLENWQLAQENKELNQIPPLLKGKVG
jgi:hypothetical protein